MLRSSFNKLKMAIDIARVRSDTRGCGTGMGIHLNNAGAAMMPSIVADACVDVLRQEEVLGGYETAAMRLSEMEALYPAVARLINCEETEVAFVESATRCVWLSWCVSKQKR